MEGKEEDVRLGANKCNESQPIETAAQGGAKDYEKMAQGGIQGIASAFGGMICALVSCTAGISGFHKIPFLI